MTEAIVSPTLRMMTDSLHTLSTPTRHAQDIRKSRFLAQAAPVDAPSSALAYVQQVSDTTATHNCWAYRIGQDCRFNDDGEPSGTAGRPILQAIDGQGFDHIVVVVTRWYGGIKLGTGGLVRAYGGTAAECLRLADRMPMVIMARWRIRCDFADLALMKARLKDIGVSIEQEHFDSDGATLQVHLSQDRTAEAKACVVAINRGRYDVIELD